ncbi:MAG: SoxR reducing system RseC family protein [Clostridiales bacterium]|jgi:sigma-E factor negative regulatory protein RseC|nr:SoxR reducing system RseC family protein [Clostridiales bacterium]MDR2750738.1 SoxR reducing system RseC family protein [Clostridiales bacterium]
MKRKNIILMIFVLGMLCSSTLLQYLFKVNYYAMLLIAAGATLALLFVTKKVLWALFASATLLPIGALLTLWGIVPTEAFSRVGIATFFFTPAILFFVLFIRIKRRRFFHCGIYLLMFGVFFVLLGIHPFQTVSVLLFFCAMIVGIGGSVRLGRVSRGRRGVAMGEYGEVVKRLDDSKVLVKLERSDACAKCGMCHPGPQAEEMLLEAKNADAAMFDLVSVELEPKSFLTAAAIMYFIPFVFLLSGFLGGYYLAQAMGFINQSPLIGFALGLALAGLVYAVIHEKEKTAGFAKYMPTASKVWTE